MSQVPLQLNLIHDVTRLWLNDGVNYELVKNPFRRVISTRDTHTTFEPVTETIVLNIRGNTYQQVQTNIDALVQRIDRVNRWKTGEMSTGLVLECLISGAMAIEEHKAFAARIHDIELRLPEMDLNFALYKGLPNVEVEITRGEWYDFYRYQRLLTSGEGRIIGSGITNLPINNYIVSGEYISPYQSEVFLSLNDFRNSTLPSFENAYVLAANDIVHTSAANFSVPLSGFLVPTLATVSDITSFSGYRQFILPAQHTTYGVRSNSLIAGTLSSRFEVFATISGTGEFLLTPTITSETGTTDARTMFGEETYYKGIGKPEVIYLGSVEIPASPSSSVLSFPSSIGNFPGILCSRLSSTGNFGIDLFYHVSADRKPTIAKLSLQSSSNASARSLYFLNPALANAGLPTITGGILSLPPFVFPIYGTYHSIVANGGNLSIEITPPNAVFNLGSDNIRFSTLQVVGDTRITMKKKASWVYEDAVIMSVVPSSQNFATALIGTNKDRWTLMNEAGNKATISGIIGVIPTYPYLPRI